MIASLDDREDFLETDIARRLARLVEYGRSRRDVFGTLVAAVTGVAGGLSNDQSVSSAKTVKQCKKIKNKKKRKKCIKKARSHDSSPQPEGICADTAGEFPCDSSCRVCQIAFAETKNRLYEIAISPSDELVVSTDEDRLDVISLAGNLIRSIGEFGVDPGEFDTPEGVAIASEGSIFVADNGNQRIQWLAPNGNIAVWPLAEAPKGIALSDAGAIYATIDFQVHRFGPDGQFLYSWGPGGEAGTEFDWPTDIAASGNAVYVVDEGANSIYRFTDNGPGNVAQDWSVGAPGVDPGEFDYPTGISTAYGLVFVADNSNDRVQAFDASTSEFVFQWIIRDDGGFATSPNDVVVDSYGGVYVTGGNGIATFEIRI